MVKSRKQRGGSTYSFTGSAGVAAGGVPYESRASINDHCNTQRGGGCGCGLQQMGGSHSFDFGNNALGKVYATLPAGTCHPKQLGGSSDHVLREISSYPSGYGFGPAGVVSTNSAHYLDPMYQPRGGRRKTHSSRRKTRRSNRNRSRKSRRT